MKLNFKTVALCATIGLLAAGCQKENVEPIGSSLNADMLVYTVDGVYHSIPTEGVQDRADFYNLLFDMAEQGHIVTVCADNSRYVAKETQTFVTGDRDEAIAWVIKMQDNGYEVTFSYDSEKHLYTCIAVK